EAMRREVIGVAPRRRPRDLDQPLVDAALEIGIHQAERDAEFRGEPALRLPPAPLDRLEQAQHDSIFLGFGRLGYARGHSPPPCAKGSYRVHAMNVNSNRSWREHT